MVGTVFLGEHDWIISGQIDYSQIETEGLAFLLLWTKQKHTKIYDPSTAPPIPPHFPFTHPPKLISNLLSPNKATMSRPATGGTFQPLRHRSGTLRDRLHGYTKQTLGAGGSLNDAVSLDLYLF